MGTAALLLLLAPSGMHLRQTFNDCGPVFNTTPHISIHFRFHESPETGRGVGHSLLWAEESGCI